MGLNVNLNHLVGAPKMEQCPQCSELTHTGCEDYDIDDESFNPEPGVIELMLGCDACEYEWAQRYTVLLKKQKSEGL